MMRALAPTASLAAILVFGAGLAAATEIRVLAESAAVPVLQTLAAQFKNDTGDEIAVTGGSPVQVMEKIKAGEIFDAVIASEDAMDRLDRDGLVNPESRRPLASSSEAGADAPVSQSDPPPSRIVYEGALTSDGSVPEAAGALIAFLGSADARSAWIAAKLEPMPER